MEAKKLIIPEDLQLEFEPHQIGGNLICKTTEDTVCEIRTGEWAFLDGAGNPIPDAVILGRAEYIKRVVNNHASVRSLLEWMSLEVNPSALWCNEMKTRAVELLAKLNP